MNYLSETLDLIGKILISYAAIRVHHRFLNEHKVDERVFAVMKLEQRLGVLGIFLIVAAYIIKVF